MSSVVRPFGAVRISKRDGVRQESWGRLAWAGLEAWLGRAWHAHSTRQALADLGDRELNDLGISRAQARFEAGRPFWDTSTRR